MKLVYLYSTMYSSCLLRLEHQVSNKLLNSQLNSLTSDIPGIMDARCHYCRPMHENFVVSAEADHCHVTLRSRQDAVSFSEWFSDATLVWKSDVVQLWRSCHMTSRQNLFACVISGGPVLYRLSAKCLFRLCSVNAATLVGRYGLLFSRFRYLWPCIVSVVWREKTNKMQQLDVYY